MLLGFIKYYSLLHCDIQDCTLQCTANCQNAKICIMQSYSMNAHWKRQADQTTNKPKICWHKLAQSAMLIQLRCCQAKITVIFWIKPSYVLNSKTRQQSFLQTRLVVGFFCLVSGSYSPPILHSCVNSDIKKYWMSLSECLSMNQNYAVRTQRREAKA